MRVPATAGLPPRFPLGESLAGYVAAYSARHASPPERLERVVATLTGSTTIDEYAVSLPQIADALEEAGKLGPLGLFIDDYDWAPPEGTELLIAALRVVETPVFFLATARLRGSGDEPPSALPVPTADLWVDHIEIRGLEPSAVAALAEDELGCQVLPSLADSLYARTLGNPMFIAETLQAWSLSDALVSTGGYVGLNGDAGHVTGSLRDMIASRLIRLDDDALAAACVVALIGREVAFDELVSVLGTPPGQLVDHLSALSADGFIANEEQTVLRYRVAHPLYTSALIECLGPARAASLHGQICRGMRGRASASELAHHAVRALHPPDDLRELLSAAAAEAEARGGHEEAAEWYGRLAEAADDPSELVRALTGQASASIRSDPAKAVQLFSYALGLERSQVGRARLLLGRARAHRVAGMSEPAMADLEEALPLADGELAFDIRHAIGVMHGFRGDLDQAEAAFVALASDSAETDARWKAIGHLGMVSFIRGDILGGARLHEQAYGHTSDPSYQTYLQSNLAWMFVLIGRWDEAETIMSSAVASAVATGNIQEEASLVGMCARLAGWRGDLATAFDHAQRATRLASRLGNPADIVDASGAMALALLENGMPGEAAGRMSKILELDRPDIEPREYSYTYAVLGEASLAIGDLGRARIALERAGNHVVNARFWQVAVDLLAAQIETSVGDPLAALDRLSRWLDEPSTIAFVQARVLEAASHAHLALGDRASALARSQEALQMMEQLGASNHARGIGSWLVEHTTRKRGRPRSALPGQLTPRETQILRLIVTGSSNQAIGDELFISLGTVKKHVENIMAKAGVSRRTELVPFALSIGALSFEDLQPARKIVARRIVRLDRLETSEPAPAD